MKKVMNKIKVFGVVMAMGGLLAVGLPQNSMEIEAAPQSCPHIATKLHLVEVPTCTMPGWYYVDCGCCGKVFDGGEIAPQGHTTSRSYGNGKICIKCRSIIR